MSKKRNKKKNQAVPSDSIKTMRKFSDIQRLFRSLRFSKVIGQRSLVESVRKLQFECVCAKIQSILSFLIIFKVRHSFRKRKSFQIQTRIDVTYPEIEIWPHLRRWSSFHTDCSRLRTGKGSEEWMNCGEHTWKSQMLTWRPNGMWASWGWYMRFITAPPSSRSAALQLKGFFFFRQVTKRKIESFESNAFRFQRLRNIFSIFCDWHVILGNTIGNKEKKKFPWRNLLLDVAGVVEIYFHEIHGRFVIAVERSENVTETHVSWIGQFRNTCINSQ